MEDDTDQDVNISLKGSDGGGRVLVVSWRIAKLSQLISDFVGEKDGELEIPPLKKVKHRVLMKVIEYCKHYADDPMQAIELPFKSHDISDIVQDWYANFVTNLTLLELWELMAAAEYMGVIPLLELTYIPLSILLVGKDSNDLRRMCDIPLPTNQRERRRKNQNKS